MTDNLKINEDSPMQRPLDEKQNVFFRVEKDLISYGYFSVTNNHKSDASALIRKQTKKVVVIRKTIDEQVIAIIRSYDELGQPGNGDLRLFMGLMKMIQDDPENRGFITNPIRFKAYDLLNLIGYKDSRKTDGKTTRSKGKATYQMVYKWLERLATTTVKLEGNLTTDEKTYYGIKGGWRFADNYNVQGEKHDDGTVKDYIEIRLTERALMNLNRYRTVPINFEAFFSLKKDIAQILVPLLQIWFYGGNGVFVKNYAEFCNLLGITEYKQESYIAQTLYPSLDELVEKKFLKTFKVEKNKAKTGFNVVLEAGANFYEALKYGMKTEVNAIGEDEIYLKLPPKTEETPATPDLTARESLIYEKLLTLEIFQSDALNFVKSMDLDLLEAKIEYAEMQANAMGEKLRSRKNYIFGILKSTQDIPVDLEVESGSNQKTKNKKGFEKDELAEYKALKFQWLLAEYDNFCFREAQKHTHTSYQKFTRNFSAGLTTWKKLLELIQSLLNYQIYETWFETLIFAGFDETTSTLQIISSEVSRDWINTYYLSVFTEAFSKLNLPESKLNFIVSEMRPELNSNSSSSDDERLIYRLILIGNYQQMSRAVTFDEFVELNQDDLETRFESTIEN